MKIKNIKFLAEANIKGNSKSKALITLVAILVISITVFTSYGVTITKSVNDFKEAYLARYIEIAPCVKSLDEKTIESIKNIDHVYDVCDCVPFTNEYFDVKSIDDKAVTQEMFFWAYPLIGDEKRSVIAGKTLEESPEYSCIIPSYFHPHNNYESECPGNDPNPFDLIGKTLSLKPGGDQGFELLYNYNNDLYDIIENEFFYIQPLEFKLKVVGVYYTAPSTYFDDTRVYISRKTAMDMTEKELKAGKIDLSSKTDPISVWWNTPSMHSYYLVLDDYDSFPEVYNKITEMGILNGDMREIQLYDYIPIMASILSFSSVVVSAGIFIVCIFIFVQSNIDSILKRKGELGLLKAVGYKNKDIMKSLIYEYLSLTVKGFIIGGIISAVFVAVVNFMFNSKTYGYQMYVVNPDLFAVLIVISLIISIIVPTACQLVILKKLSKITPKDAINN